MLVTRLSNTGTFTIAGEFDEVTNSPFSPANTNYAALFNGSTDYFSLSSNVLFNLSGDFTIEAWIYIPSGTGGGVVGIGTTDGNVTTIRVYNSKIQFWITGTSNYAQGTTTVALNTWLHIAVVRNGSSTNNCKCYLNGVLECQITTNLTPSSYAVSIGRDYPGLSADYFTGYISNLRIVNGTAIYTSNFTVPTTRLSPAVYTMSTSTPVEYLVVGGGGAGAGSPNVSYSATGCGGGGAGGLQYGSAFTVAAGVAITVTVGGGATGSTARGPSGSPSSFSSVTSSGGGGGGGGAGSSTFAGLPGGSGGGGSDGASGGSGTGGQGTSGGTAVNAPGGGGGGGGAGIGGGGNGSTGVGGAGGVGLAYDMSGVSTYYAGGGGGGVRTGGTGALGGTGGGGNGATVTDANGSAGSGNTGGGGGGAAQGSHNPVGGNGGSGIVIVRYPIAYAAASDYTNGTYAIVGGYRVYTWLTSGSLTLQPSSVLATSLLTLQDSTIIDNSGNSLAITPSGTPTMQVAFPFINTYKLTTTYANVFAAGFSEVSIVRPIIEYLVVAGGGGGGTRQGAGGGAGGMVTGTNFLAPANTSVTITVGAGGPGGPHPAGVWQSGVNGSNSVFSSFTANGGGGGGGFRQDGVGGGSGGGGGGGGISAGQSAGSGTAGQGNAGGGGQIGGGYNGGGGGGAGITGYTALYPQAGNGGYGLVWPAGSGTYYAGGGGCGNAPSTNQTGTGGNGGGGNGGGSTQTQSGSAGAPGAANTGGGGGGGGPDGSGNVLYGLGGNGGSGIVIIKYPTTYVTPTIPGTLTYTLDTTTYPGYYLYTFTAGTGAVRWDLPAKKEVRYIANQQTYVEIWTAGELNEFTPPIVTITASSYSLVAYETATLTFTLSEDSTTFTSSDVAVTGGILSGFTGSGTVYTALFTPTAQSTTPCVVTIAAGSFFGTVGDTNPAATATITINTVVPTMPASVQYLIIAGGGGGGSGKTPKYDGNGGNGGGVLTGTITTATTMTITVGIGGTANTVGNSGNSGGNSSISSTTASGGGGGGITTQGVAQGGDGAGGSHSGKVGGVGAVNPITLSTTGQLSGGSYYIGGGGGAPSTTYITNTSWSGQGGDSYLTGTQSLITGVAFTFECWVYTIGTPSGYYLIGNDTGPLIGYNGSTFAFAHQGGFSVSSSNPPQNQWAHIAVTRDASSNVVMYVNGSASGSGNDSSSFTGAQTYIIDGASNHYISNMRIVNGSVVYTGNFTPPTSALSSISGTTLLTFQGSVPGGTLQGNAHVSVSSGPFAVGTAGTGGAGGLGGGAAAGTNAGLVNTGGGGGGGSAVTSTIGGAGGSGVVVISYPTSSLAASSYTNGTYQILGSNRVYTWTASGSITF